jgi:replication fork protection complex subunit Csm3/Swi3
MTTIDDLWDEPVESEPAPSLAKKPVASEDPLFLQSDSDNEGGTGAAGPSRAPDDIEALFDVDDDDENGQLSNVTYEQLRRDAQSGGKAHDGPADGDQGAEEDPSKGALNAKSKSNKGEDGGNENTKRTIPRLDEGLLLSEKGIPALIKDAKQWRPKGKGHEVSESSQSFKTHLCGSSEISDFGPQSSHSDVPILGPPDVPTTYVQRRN